MKKGKKAMALLLALTLLVTALPLTGCTQSGSSDDTTFTFWLYTAGDMGYYDSYNDNPSLKYALSKTYGPDDKQVNFEFWIPASGTAQDNFSTMLGSGDYADIIENTIGQSVETYYKDDMILDLTEYVKEYMPNYLAFLEKHPEVKEYAVSNIDGEEKYLGILSATDAYSYQVWGHCYRRDWIVKYGTNPVTGEPFTGGYTDENDKDSWGDDVIFPSGGTDPVYISDWEWMFEIFETAMADLGIEKGYCYSIPYNGYNGQGELAASFGGGASGYWFRTLDNEVVYGPTSSQFKAYLECVNNWYEKGWLDPYFDERVSDMFFMIDSTAVYQGKVGMWYGLQSQLGGRMDSGDELTSGIYVAGAPTPINDVYGEEENKFVEPYCGFASTLISTTYIVTKAAEGKDLATLLSFFDYFYTEEGALLRTVGFNAEQAAAIDSDFITEQGLEDGCYTVEENGSFRLVDKLIDDNALAGACISNKVPGVEMVGEIDHGYADTFQSSLEQWIRYKCVGNVMGANFLTKMSDEDADTYSDTATRVTDYLTENSIKFIKGTLDIENEVDWNNFVTVLKKYGVDTATEVIQKYADEYPLQ